jgi:signal transduction histidine kinase
MKRVAFLLLSCSWAFSLLGQSAFYRISKDSLKILILSTKEDTSKVNLLIDLANRYPWSYPNTALIYANEALELAEKLAYKKGIYNARREITSALITLGNYPLALEYSLKNEELSQTFNDPISKVSSLSILAGTYLRTGNFNNWQVYIKQALALAKKSKLPFDEGLILNSIASRFLEKNQPDSAFYYATQSYRLINTWPSQPINIGHAYLQKNMFDSAVYWFKIGLELATLNQTEQDFVDVDNFLALIHKKKNNIDSAIWYAKKALAEKISANYPLGTLKASGLLVSLYESQKKPDSALKYLRTSIILRDSLFSREKVLAQQNLLYNKQQKERELKAARLKLKNQVQFYLLSGGVTALLIIAFILTRANRQKQKSYIELQQQKEQINFHRTIAENSLNELKATQAQLVQSEKMASLGELTAGIAHEIQNPLNFVNNFSEVNAELIDELKNEVLTNNKEEVISIANEIKENEQKIIHHGRRADAIVKGMLQHSRVSTGHKEQTDISALADEYLRMSYHGMRAKDKSFNATLETNFDESIGRISVGTQDIGRVLLNLFNNAFYAVNEKKKQTGEAYEPKVVVSTKKLKDRVEIVVKDNGNGIPPKVVDKIFQPFFTTKPTGQGTGLGLSLSYDIVKAHGGDLSVKTKEGEYAAFIIELPLYSTASL